MESTRWLDLEKNPNLDFTREEEKAGWHRCADWDFMVVGPGMPEFETCLCFLNDQEGSK